MGEIEMTGNESAGPSRPLSIEEVPVASLRKTSLLRRRHSRDQLDRCVHSLLTYGQYSPLVVSGNEILCGTLVYDALRRIKAKTARIVQVGELSEEKRRELRYLDNRTFEMSFWKNDDLKLFLMGLDKGFLENCGYREEEVEQMVNGFADEGGRAKRSLIRELNDQPEEWYCPKCGWKGTFVEDGQEPSGSAIGKRAEELEKSDEEGKSDGRGGNGKEEGDGAGQEAGS